MREDQKLSGWWLALRGAVCAAAVLAGCFSNPTPHPARDTGMNTNVPPGADASEAGEPNVDGDVCPGDDAGGDVCGSYDVQDAAVHQDVVETDADVGPFPGDDAGP